MSSQVSQAVSKQHHIHSVDQILRRAYYLNADTFDSTGGNLDQDDHNYHPFLNRRASKDKSNEPSDLQIALKLCAIRETFEETGILTGLSPGVDIPSSVLTDFRQKVCTT
jgi:8-oxo-dGTP pyrophosphatase MutT (NUDIX family)